MKQNSVISIALLLLATLQVSGQKLVAFKSSLCEKGNPQKFKINTAINKIEYEGDSMLIKLTWIDNCSFKPKFSLESVKNDTIHFKYKNEAEETVSCNCAYGLEFVLQKIEEKNYIVKINNYPIDPDAKRYHTDGYIVEYFPGKTLEKSKVREIYSIKGKLVAEVYYDESGKIISERFYDEGLGFFTKEIRY